MNPRVARRLRDALDAATSIGQFISAETAESYGSNRLVQAAVHHELMIVGEALNVALRIRPSLIEDTSRLTGWVGLRNILIHTYSDVNPGIVWKTVTTEVPELIATLERMLAEQEIGDQR